MARRISDHQGSNMSAWYFYAGTNGDCYHSPRHPSPLPELDFAFYKLREFPPPLLPEQIAATTLYVESLSLQETSIPPAIKYVDPNLIEPDFGVEHRSDAPPPPPLPPPPPPCPPPPPMGNTIIRSQPVTGSTLRERRHSPSRSRSYSPDYSPTSPTYSPTDVDSPAQSPLQAAEVQSADPERYPRTRNWRSEHGPAPSDLPQYDSQGRELHYDVATGEPYVVSEDPDRPLRHFDFHGEPNRPIFTCPVTGHIIRECDMYTGLGPDLTRPPPRSSPPPSRGRDPSRASTSSNPRPRSAPSRPRSHPVPPRPSHQGHPMVPRVSDPTPPSQQNRGSNNDPVFQVPNYCDQTGRALSDGEKMAIMQAHIDDLERRLRTGNPAGPMDPVQAARAKLAQRPNPFYGTPKEDRQDVHTWLHQFEIYMKVVQFPEEEWTMLAFTFLRSSAFESMCSWRKDLRGKGNWTNSWLTFCERMVQQFGDPQHQFSLRCELRALKVLDGNVAAYLKKFHTVASEISDMSDVEKLSTFIHGLDRKTFDENIIEPGKSVMWQDYYAFHSFLTTKFVVMKHHKRVQGQGQSDQPRTHNQGQPYNKRFKRPREGQPQDSDPKRYRHDRGQSSKGSQPPSDSSKHHKQQPDRNRERSRKDRRDRYNLTSTTWSELKVGQHLSGKQKEELDKQGRCYYCFKEGHSKRDCPQRGQKSGKESGKSHGKKHRK